MMNLFKQLAVNMLQRNGYAITNIKRRNVRPKDLRHGLFHLLREMGFRPNHIVDIGANRGLWTRDAVDFFPQCQYTLLEPNKQLVPHFEDLLEKDNVNWIEAGAGRKKDTLRFTIAERDDSSSFVISDEEALKRNLQQVEVPIYSLNELIAERNLPIPELVKVDAEGLDVDVLNGATDLMGKTEFFLVEVGFAPASEETSLRNVVNVMHDFGYLPFDITENNRSVKSRVLWLCEFCFIRKDSELLKGLQYSN
ncbi:hypothetical protein LF1_23520 [Rubripirellula obstinata]|uniref:Methyltransferase FkbM domain-containing protein n=1 Tax=Rubripirellula obstinata TaxID=406547 RepID=A0A5B1CIS4_9BACT|nr:FkbM family methyltransferase [Rubripirellula obstinata]KAA1259815.1 hypothetical protein LF1_23520 [Rubripirellula obstinata]